MSAYSYHSHTALGLADLHPYDTIEDYPPIYPESEMDQYYKSHLGVHFPLHYSPDHPSLTPLDSPQTIAPRTLEGYVDYRVFLLAVETDHGHQCLPLRTHC